jgi:hypothetical protein
VFYKCHHLPAPFQPLIRSQGLGSAGCTGQVTELRIRVSIALRNEGEPRYDWVCCTANPRAIRSVIPGSEAMAGWVGCPNIRDASSLVELAGTLHHATRFRRKVTTIRTYIFSWPSRAGHCGLELTTPRQKPLLSSVISVVGFCTGLATTLRLGAKITPLRARFGCHHLDLINPLLIEGSRNRKYRCPCTFLRRRFILLVNHLIV